MQFSKDKDELINRMNPEHILLLDSKVPRQFISFDEQNLRRCLEFIHISSDKRITSCSLSSDITVSTKSKSMLDILNSPLFHQLSPTVRDRASLVDLRHSKCTSVLSSSSGSDSSESRKLGKDKAIRNKNAHGSDHVCKSVSPLSDTIHTSADHSSSFEPAITSQWMLHIKESYTFPCYVFSSDDQNDIYVANLVKVDSPNDKVTNCMYTFHCRARNRKKDGIQGQELNLVGKMRVSTTITLLSDATEVKEILYVLYGFNDNCAQEFQTGSQNQIKSRGLSMKMSDVLKASHTFKRRRSMELDISKSMKDIDSTHSCQNDRLEDHFPPNLELAAIVVKEHICRTNNDVDIGGWGLKFLNKTWRRLANASLEAEVPSQCLSHSNADCSTRIDIIIPAGIHGLPRSKTSSPSSLIDRWTSGGNCDCGGWDMGCALTVLKTKQTEALPQAKTIDIFEEGSKQDSPTMKMVNIHNGSYCIPISFRSTLSALQSFSIAVAILHTRTHSPNLRVKL